MADTNLRRVNKVSAKLARTPGSLGEVNSILRHISETAQETFKTDACVVLGFNPITSKFLGSQTVVGNLHVNNGLLHDKPRQNGVTQQVIDEGILFVRDLEAAPHYFNRFTRKEGIRSFVGLALLSRHRRRPLGVIYLDYKQPRVFDADDHEQFKIFATQAAFLLQETWLELHLQEVALIGQKINHNLATVENLFRELQTYVDNVLDESHKLVLGLYQSQTNTLDLHTREYNQTGFMNIPLQGAYKSVIETQKSWFIEELNTEAEGIQLSVLDNMLGIEQKESLIIVPLMLKGEPLGILSIQHPTQKAYGREDLFVLELLANYISLALHNMRLYRSLTQLNETGQILTQQLESEQTLQATVEKIRDATEADLAILFPYEPVGRRFILPPRMAGRLLDPAFPTVTILRPDDMAVLALNNKDPIFAKDSDATYTELRRNTNHANQGNFKDREKIRSVAVMPLRVGEEDVGVLFVNFRHQQHFDDTQRLLIVGLAHYAAIAIKNSQTFGTLSLRRVRELEILQHIDSELNRSLDLKSVLNTILRWAGELVPADESSILLYNPKTQVLEVAAARGRHAETIRKQSFHLNESRGITHWALEHKQLVCVDNVRRDMPWRNYYHSIDDDMFSELAAPLLDGEEAIGVLNFESAREAAFQQEDQDFLHTLAGQAVLAITKAQAYEREKRLAEEGRVLNEISKQITSQLDINHVFHLILEKALELTHSMRGNLMLYDHHRNDLWMAAERGVIEEKKGRRQSLDQGVVGNAASNRQLLNVDLTQPPWNDVNLDFFPGTRSELAVPMLAGDELYGVLNIESTAPHNFGESDERLLQGLAGLAIVALQNAQAFEGEKRLADERQVLNEISKQITSQLDHGRVFDFILEKALELTQSTLGSLHLYDPMLKELRMVAEYGVAEENVGKRQSLEQGIVGYVAARKRPINVEDVSQHPWEGVFLEFYPGTRSELAVPMLEGDELRGVLNVESPSPNHFDENNERLLQELANLAVVALQNAERYEKAEREAQHFKLLYQAGQELSKVTDLSQLEQAYNIVVQLTEMQSNSQVVIYRYNQENAELVLTYASNHRARLFEVISVNEGLSGQVARERRPIVVHDVDHLPSDVDSVKQSDPTMHSLVVVPIHFKDQYYGNLGLRHEEVGHFRDTDIDFFEALAQQLASTIHRLETVQERKEFEQRASAAEEMSSLGQSAFELTHRLGNDLGLVNFYISDIQSELGDLGVSNDLVSRKLDNISQAVQNVLFFSGDLKQELAKLGAKEETAGEPVGISTRELLEEALVAVPLPANISICVELDNDVAGVRGFQNLIADILRNLVANAVQAMPDGGTITLRGRNAGRYVAMEVSDTGVGIPQEKLPQVFDLFFSTKGSSGFGLWSARRNALRNHGELKVESEPGEGTTFTLFLPRIDVMLG